MNRPATPMFQFRSTDGMVIVFGAAGWEGYYPYRIREVVRCSMLEGIAMNPVSAPA